MVDRTYLLSVRAAPGLRGRRTGGGDLHWDGLIVRPPRGSDGVKVDDLSRLTTFVDADGGGLKHRTAWAGAGDGAVRQNREYVYTERGERRKRNGPVDRFRQRTRGARAWTTNADMEALRSCFDTNGKRKMTVVDADIPQFLELSLKPLYQPPQSHKRNMHLAGQRNNAPSEAIYCDLGFCFCAVEFSGSVVLIKSKPYFSNLAES